MAGRTRARGLGDTGRGAFSLAVALAALLHLPLQPYWALLGWLLPREEVTWGDLDGEAVIPIDLDVEEPQGGVPPGSLVPPPSAESAAEAAAIAAREREEEEARRRERERRRREREREREKERDAGTDAAGDAPDDAPAHDATDDTAPRDAGPEASPALAGEGVDGGATPLSQADAGTGRPIRDPIGASGATAKVAPKDPNVSVLISAERVRKHPLGMRLGPILASIRQWNDFFAGTGIDPIRDFDRILLAGPQFRDSSQVVAILEYSTPEPAMRKAIDALVARSQPPGEWLPRAGYPIARARADRSARLFGLPAPRMLVVLPDEPRLVEQARGLRRFPRMQEALVVFLRTPHRAFRGLPVKIPDSIAWVRLSLTTTEDGGADVLVDAEDRSPADAARHAKDLTREIDAIRSVSVPLLGRITLLDHVEFFPADHHIRANVHVSQKQLNRLMILIGQAAGANVGTVAEPPQ